MTTEVGRNLFRWRRWGGAVVLALVVVLPVRAAQADSEIVVYDEAWPGDLNEVSPEGDAFATHRAPSKAVGFFASLGSVVVSAVTFPVKMVVGVTGAIAGGIAGGMTGGNEEAAEGIWNVTTDGNYFVGPQVLEGRRTVRLTGEPD